MMPGNAVTVTANFEVGITPTVISQTPTVGTTGVAITVRPTVVFSTPMDATTITNSTVQLMQGTMPITATVGLSGDELTATITPSSSLVNGTVYWILVITGAKSSTGDVALTTSYGSSTTSEFTTVGATVATKPTQTFLFSLPNPSDNGQTVYFCVAVVANRFNGIPTGTVTFKDGSSVIGKGILDKLGFASINISTLSSGVHDIIAIYSGDSNFTTSTSNMIIQKVRYVTITVLISNTQSSVIGQPIQFTATVSPKTAAGSITFYDGNIRLGSASLSSGVASNSTGKLTIGTHKITAVYSGDSNFSGSVSNVVNQVITKN
jgi:hypothetical protein